MTEPASTPGTAPVTDRRPVPRGVLPRGAQAWLMAAIALGIIAVIVVAGKPEPAGGPASVRVPAQEPVSPDRVRDYRDRLRLLESRAAQDTQPEPPQATPSVARQPYAPIDASVTDDPLAADRRRREYESLFATNLVFTRRPGFERATSAAPTRFSNSGAFSGDASASPSIDEIADAVVRATTRAGTAPAIVNGVPMPENRSSNTRPIVDAEPTPARPAPRAPTGPISAAGPLHRLTEGTLIDTVLTNRLESGATAPVICLVTNPVYSHAGQQVVIPAGARLIGETKAVQSLGETRLAVAFHRIVMPDGSSYSLDDFLGANQIGDAGLRDQVNHHYWSTFGAAGAVGLISGLAQFLGTMGLNRGNGDRTVVIAGSTSDATSQATLQVMNRFLNRMPTVTIREGHRIKVFLTSDLELPAYQGPGKS